MVRTSCKPIDQLDIDAFLDFAEQQSLIDEIEQASVEEVVPIYDRISLKIKQVVDEIRQTDLSDIAKFEETRSRILSLDLGLETSDMQQLAEQSLIAAELAGVVEAQEDI